jgi:hypothetical protein
LTAHGTGLHYRSYYDDGATTWEGDFLPGQAAQTGGTRLMASQWTRTEGGMVVDVLDLTPQGDGYRITLREGFGKAVYSSGSCTVAGNTVTCEARNSSGVAGQIVLSLRGESLHYRSAYDGGRRTWEGDFVRNGSPR